MLKKKQYVSYLILVGIILVGAMIVLGLKWYDSITSIDTFHEDTSSDSKVLLQNYREQKAWIEAGGGLEEVGLKRDHIRNVEIYSVRFKDPYIEYTVEVTTEVPLLQGDTKCIKQKYDLLLNADKKVSLGNKKKIMKSSPFVYEPMEQVAYLETMDQREQQMIQDMFNLLLSKDRIFFEKYEKNWIKGFNQWCQFMMQAPALYSYLHINEEHYKDHYSANLLPCGIGEEMIEWDQEGIQFQLTHQTTKNIKYVKVNIPIQVLRDYYNKLYYNYEYLVTLNKEAITGIKFIRKEPL